MIFFSSKIHHSHSLIIHIWAEILRRYKFCLGFIKIDAFSVYPSDTFFQRQFKLLMAIFANTQLANTHTRSLAKR